MLDTPDSKTPATKPDSALGTSGFAIPPRANSPRPEHAPVFKTPPLQATRPPRCPPFVQITHPDQLLPYLEHVARRSYNHGLNACWDLKPGERVLLRVDNWHSDLVIQACQKILEKYRVNYEIKHIDRGPVPQWVGADEVDYYLFRTRELADWMDWWEEEEQKQQYDKIFMGYGGPVLAERFIKIQRMPFITPEILASPAHTMPIAVINAIDKWTWDRVRSAKRARIVDPEGTDIEFTNHSEYWDSRREFYSPDLTTATWRGNEHFGKQYLPGHITGRPWMFHPTKEDGNGVIAGTTNHITACDWTQLIIENSKITRINEGGEFGDKLRAVMARAKDIQYPTFPDKGIMYWWEASIGTNPHIHRPRKDFPSGFVNCLYERVRSGVMHMGFGTIISSIFLIAIGAKLFVAFVSLTRIAPNLLDWLQGSGAPVLLVITGIVLFYLVLGMFLDSIGILVLTLPFTVPLIEGYGFDLIWFGVVVVKLLEIGLITPPVGLNVFVIKSVSPPAVTLETIFKGVGWFLILDMVV